MFRLPQARRRRTLALLVLPALLLRALLPPGFMPAAHGGFGFALTICPGHGLVAMLGDPAAGDTTPAPAGSHHDAPCAFAAAAAGLAPPSALPPFDTNAARIAGVPPLPVTTAATCPDVRAQSPRGPPALA